MRGCIGLCLLASGPLLGCKIDVLDDDAFGSSNEPCLPESCRSDGATVTFAVSTSVEQARAAKLRASVCRDGACADGALDWSCGRGTFCMLSCQAVAGVLGGTMEARPIVSGQRCGESELEEGICVTLRLPTEGLAEGPMTVDVALDDDSNGSRWIDARVEVNLETRSETSCGVALECLGGEAHVSVDAAPPDDASVSDGSTIVPVVAAGSDHTCATNAAGRIACWGGAAGEPPEGAFRSLAVGDRYACGLDVAGAIRCWGSDLVHERALEPPFGSFGALAVGARFGCAVRESGGLECWGRRECGYSNGKADATSSSISAYGGTLCVSLGESGITCVGDRAEALPDASRVAVGGDHVCVLDEEGTVRCMGSNEHGQLDAPGGRYVSVVAGEAHSCALAADGRVTCWGAGTVPMSGECMRRPECGQSAPPEETFAQISSGAFHVCGITTTGQVQCWGDDTYGKATPPDLEG